MVYHMSFPANHELLYFHVFILLLISICLAIICMIVLHPEYLCHPLACQASSPQVSGRMANSMDIALHLYLVHPRFSQFTQQSLSTMHLRIKQVEYYYIIIF